MGATIDTAHVLNQQCSKLDFVFSSEFVLTERLVEENYTIITVSTLVHVMRIIGAV